MLPPRLLMVHNASARREHNVAKLTRGQQLHNPFLKIGDPDIVAGRDDTSLVEAAVELDNDLAAAVVVDLFELADVASGKC